MSCKQFNLPDSYVSYLLFSFIALHFSFYSVYLGEFLAVYFHVAHVNPFLKVQLKCCLHKFFPDFLQVESSCPFPDFPRILQALSFVFYLVSQFIVVCVFTTTRSYSSCSRGIYTFHFFCIFHEHKSYCIITICVITQINYLDQIKSTLSSLHIWLFSSTSNIRPC